MKYNYKHKDLTTTQKGRQEMDFFTLEDVKLLRQFLEEYEEINKEAEAIAPNMTEEEAADFFKKLDKNGTFPEEYRGKMEEKEELTTFDTPKGQIIPTKEHAKKVFYDTAYKDINNKFYNLLRKYGDTLEKAKKTILADDTNADILAPLNEIIPQNTEILSSSLIAKFGADFPLDKINNNIWRMLETNPDGQMFFNFDVDMRSKADKKNDTIIVPVSLDFSDLEGVTITKQLEPYDKRVYIAVSTISNRGYNTFTIQQIYQAMGYDSKPNNNDIKKINDSITKMNRAHLYIDTYEESKKYNYGRFTFDGSLLPMKRITRDQGGQIKSAIICLLDEPPLIKLARERKQITTISRQVLAPRHASLTNANIQLQDYFIEQISFIKKGKINNKMKLATIYENAGITTTKQKQRAPEKIKQLLSDYVDVGFISGFSITADGVIIKTKKED